jgi:hypothetical protein
MIYRAKDKLTTKRENMKGNIRETLTQDTRRGSKEEAATCTNDGKSACGEKKKKKRGHKNDGCSSTCSFLRERERERKKERKRVWMV